MNTNYIEMINQFYQEPSIESLLLLIEKARASIQIQNHLKRQLIEEHKRLSHFTFVPQNQQNFINQLFAVTNEQELRSFIYKVFPYPFVKQRKQFNREESQPTYQIKFGQFQYYLNTANYKEITRQTFVSSVAEQFLKIFKILKNNYQDILIKTDLIGLCQYIWMKQRGNNYPNKNEVIKQFLEYFYKKHRKSFIDKLLQIIKQKDESLYIQIKNRHFKQSKIQFEKNDSFCHHYQYYKGKNEQQAAVNKFQSKYFYIVVSKQLIKNLMTGQLQKFTKKQLYWSSLSAEYYKIQSSKYQDLIDVFLDLFKINQQRFWVQKYKVILRNQLLNIEINYKTDVKNKQTVKISMNVIDTAYPQYSHYSESKKLLLLIIEQWKVYNLSVTKVIDNCIQIPFKTKKSNTHQVKAYSNLTNASTKLTNLKQQHTMVII